MDCHTLNKKLWIRRFPSKEDTQKIRKRNFKFMDPNNKLCAICCQKVEIWSACRHCHNFDCEFCNPHHFCDICGELKYIKDGTEIRFDIPFIPQGGKFIALIIKSK